MTEAELHQLLQATFPARNVTSALKHFRGIVQDFQARDWGDAIAKAGKFVEAVLKALATRAQAQIPKANAFKVDTYINELAKAAADRTVSLTIPRACRFVYEIASNRGGRHDPDEIDPNEMDATAAVGLCSWILAELVRYAQKGGDPAETMKVVSGLMQRRYPFIEDVDGRVYFHLKGMSAPDVALLTLSHVHPGRMARADLVAAIERHGFSNGTAQVAVTRLGRMVDDDGTGRLRLLAPGRAAADELIARGAELRRNGTRGRRG